MLVGLALMAAYLVDVFNNPDLAESSDQRVMWTLLIVFLGAWAMSVYWWLYLRPGGRSFEARLTTRPAAQSAAAGIARRIGLYVVTAPIAFIMGLALVRDPGRMGEPSSASGAPLSFFVVVGVVVSVLMTAAWVLSTFRYRTPALLLQVAVVWLGGLLYAYEVRTHVNGWDVAEDVVLLGTALLQLIPGRHTRSASDDVPGRTKQPVAF